MSAARGAEEWGEEPIGRETAADHPTLHQETGELPASESQLFGPQYRAFVYEQSVLVFFCLHAQCFVSGRSNVFLLSFVCARTFRLQLYYIRVNYGAVSCCLSS